MVRFGVYEVDLRAGELRKSGVKIKLQEQPFQILALLLGRPGDVVTREEIQKQLWPADTFVDFEHSLNAAVKRLREALGDSADNPRFVETLPRRGYKFIYPVEGKQETLPEPISQPRLLWMGLIVVAVAIASAITYYLWPKPALAETDTILIADFKNNTKDEIFDGTLKHALAVKLEESPFFNVFPDRRVRETLKLMKREPDEPVTHEIAQEICERQGLKAMVLGEISPLGSNYVINLEAVDCQTGESLAREQVEAESKEEVLKALGEATTPWRRQLGESLASIQRFDTPLFQATTASLEALKFLTLGIAERGRSGELGAISFFKRAIELDPDFSYAYVNLSASYGNIGEGELSGEYAKKAYALREHASERERLAIIENYHFSVIGDLHKSAETLKLITRTYPRDAAAHLNLSGTYAMLGQHEKSLEEIEEAFRIRPSPLRYGSLANHYLMLDRFEDVKKLYKEAKTAKMARHLFYSRFVLALIEGDEQTVARIVDEVKGTWFEDGSLRLQARIATHSGKFQRARRFFAQSLEVSQQYEFDVFPSGTMAEGGLAEALGGNYGRAEERATAAISRSRSIPSLQIAAFTLALSGNTQEAQVLAQELAERFPTWTLVQSLHLPNIHAAIELKRGNPERAIELLQAAIPLERATGGLRSIYLRSLAYMKLGKGQEAVTEFQKILNRRVECQTSAQGVLYPLAHLGLARANALAGDDEEARKAYDKFFELWKDADPDIPILLEAKAEYAKLQQSMASVPVN
jgi:DNA-binding winged helix-turn-helix (wHTH) protein/tetratricopeptide (TPR) repeat protein